VQDLSSGGLGLETRLDLNAGEDVKIRLYPHRRADSIEIDAIVWNVRQRSNAAGRKALPLVGLKISRAPEKYTALLQKLEVRDQSVQNARRSAERSQRGAASTTEGEVHRARGWRAEAAASVSIVEERVVDSALPRPKDPLPPPKMPDPDSLPLFVIRIKQKNGSRTRRLKLRAASLHDVESQVREDLGGEWEILEISSGSPADQ
jgi:hypothetical protein